MLIRCCYIPRLSDLKTPQRRRLHMHYVIRTSRRGVRRPLQAFLYPPMLRESRWRFIYIFSISSLCASFIITALRAITPMISPAYPGEPSTPVSDLEFRTTATLSVEGYAWCPVCIEVSYLRIKGRSAVSTPWQRCSLHAKIIATMGTSARKGQHDDQTMPDVAYA